MQQRSVRRVRVFLCAVVASLLVAQPLVAEQKVHLIGVYESTPAGPGATVFVRKTAEPVTLILSSYEATHWSVILEEGARLARLLVNSDGPSSAHVYNEDFSDADVSVEYLIDEKVCYPGDSRSAMDPVSVGVFPDRNRKKQLSNFFAALERETDIKVDREGSLYRNNYTARDQYIVSGKRVRGFKHPRLLR